MVVFLFVMRKLVGVFIILIFFVSGCSTYTPPDITKKECSAEAMVCPGGSSVGRNPDNNCEFDPCPSSPIYCDASVKCPSGMECYKFEGNDKPYCYSGDPCGSCPSPEKCAVLESYPPQIKCA
jgi:hypothetical protein